MAIRVRFRPEARTEIREARRWYEGRAPGLGRAFLGELDAVMAFIRMYPAMYRAVTDDQQVRRALFRRFPYSIVYETVAPDEVLVLGCRHVRQDEVDWAITRRDG